GFKRVMQGDQDTGQNNEASLKPEWNRHIFAFESDLLDGALVHWAEESHGPTLEMIPGFKKEMPPENKAAYAVESVASGLRDSIAESPVEIITKLDTANLPGANDLQNCDNVAVTGA